MNTIRLENTSAGHNKFYEFVGIKAPGRFTVKGLYGRIGQAPKETIIYDGDDVNAANSEFHKKMASKQKKGYKLVSGNGAPTKAAEEKKNSSDLPVVWAMNAQGVKSSDHLNMLLDSPEYIAQIKLDGMRAIVHITSDGLRIFSRSAGIADPTRPLEKSDSLPHLASLRLPDLVGTILDCEILAPGKDSAELSGLVHRKEVDSDNTNVKLFVFDILSVCGKKFTDRPLRYRLSELLQISHKLQSEHIVILPYSTTPIQKRKLYDKVIASGGEGIMLKRLDAPYCEGERPSNNWYKAKKSAAYDCVITGFSTGKGKYNTQIGAVKFGQYVEGKLIELGQASGMNDDIRKDMSVNPKKYLGKVVTIKGMERLKSGAIRHPQFGGMRIDKHPLQCIWYGGEQ